MATTPRNEFLYALTGMEKIHSNYFDSAHGLFGVVEKKYVMNSKKAKKLLKELTSKYNILQIHEETHFEYQDVYLDTLEHDFFKIHRKELAHVLNARTRHNSTNKTGVFQVIDRSNKRKSVYHFTPSESERPFSNESLTFFNGVFASIKGKSPKFLPFPNIVVSFKRIILYNKTQSERVNIDYDIHFKNVRGKHTGETVSLGKLVFVESKTLDKQNFIERYMKKYDAKKIKCLSKFLIGMHAVGGVSLKGKHKKELNILERIVAGK